jgi:hypothetical protein
MHASTLSFHTVEFFDKLHTIYTSSRTTWLGIFFMTLIMKYKEQYVVLLKRHLIYALYQIARATSRMKVLLLYCRNA